MQDDPQKTSQPVSRRAFLFNGAAAVSKIAGASTLIYAVGSALKSVDGSLVAGAKTWYYDQGHGQSGFDCLSVIVGPFTTGAACNASRSDWLANYPTGPLGVSPYCATNFTGVCWHP